MLASRWGLKPFPAFSVWKHQITTRSGEFQLIWFVFEKPWHQEGPTWNPHAAHYAATKCWKNLPLEFLFSFSRTTYYHISLSDCIRQQPCCVWGRYVCLSEICSNLNTMNSFWWSHTADNLSHVNRSVQIWKLIQLTRQFTTLEVGFTWSNTCFCVVLKSLWHWISRKGLGNSLNNNWLRSKLQTWEMTPMQKC